MARRASSSPPPMRVLLTAAVMVALAGGAYALYGWVSDPYRKVPPLPVHSYLENANSLRGNVYRLDATVSQALEYSARSGRLFSVTDSEGEVVAILGFDDAQHREVIADLPVEVRLNHDWQEGIAATLRSAVRAAKERDAALLVLPCDQYRITPDDLRALYDTWRWTPGIACVSRWGRYAGAPAILPIGYHDEVLRLRGDVGARSVLFARHRPRPDEIPNPRATFDLDSPEEMQVAEEWAACQR